MQSLPAGLCVRCQASEPPFAFALAPLLYEFPVDAAIKACKFRRQLFYLPVFGRFLFDAFEKHFTDVDALVAVPLHRWRHALRGFNQAEELCKYLHRRTDLPIAANVRRRRATATQSGLTFAERKHNLRHAFSVHGRLRSRHPLIVDDVMTTGETCKELAKTLLAKGAQKVSVLTIARARPIG
jgi:ComF family protein